MGFQLNVTPDVRRTLQLLPLALRNKLVQELQRLANAPFQLSVERFDPRWPRAWEYVSDLEFQQHLHTFLVVWRPNSDGGSIDLLLIVHHDRGAI